MTTPRRLPILAALIATSLLAAPAARAADDVPPPAAAADPVAGVHVLTLAEALRAARAHQPAIANALGNLVTAEGQSDQARAALLPQLNGTASYQRATRNYSSAQLGSAPPAVALLNTVPTWKFAANFSQLVTDFGETLNKWRAAHLSAEASAASVHVSEAQVTFNLRTAFFAARAAKDMVAVARDNLANQERHLSQVTTLVDVGNRPKIDLTQARADRANAQLQVINAENTYDVAKATLNQAMGLERSIDYDLGDDGQPPVEGEEQATQQLVDEAQKMRPEMLNLRLLQQSQELSLRSARDMMWPALSLNGIIYDAGPTLDHMSPSLSGTVTLTVPLIQGGSVLAQIKQAKGQVMQAQAQLETQRQQVRLDVEQARLGVRAAKGSIAAADDALANSRDRLALAEGRYTTGIGNIIELGDAQLAVTTAAAQNVQAHYQLYTARAQLMKALGRQ
jgi:outer membrane protein